MPINYAELTLGMEGILRVKKRKLLPLCFSAQKKQTRPVRQAGGEVNLGTKNRWNVMRAQRNRFSENANGVK